MSIAKKKKPHGYGCVVHKKGGTITWVGDASAVIAPPRFNNFFVEAVPPPREGDILIDDAGHLQAMIDAFGENAGAAIDQVVRPPQPARAIPNWAWVADADGQIHFRQVEPEEQVP